MLKINNIIPLWRLVVSNVNNAFVILNEAFLADYKPIIAALLGCIRPLK